MSVQSQIDRLNAIKQRIRTNLVAQGITVPEDTMLEAMAEQILSVAGDPGRGIKSIARTSGNGAAGTTDTYTITYTDGSTSTFQVRNGANGTNGTNGADGADGIGISQAQINADGELILYFSNNTSVNLGKIVGADGANGKDGTDGKDGNDGITPYIGGNGNWYIGATDTGVSAQGKAGYTPIKYTDYYTDADKKELKDELAAKLIVQHTGDSADNVMSQAAVTAALETITALPHGGSREWLESNGDKSKLYQIGGYAWGYVESNGWTKSDTQFRVVASAGEMTDDGGTPYLLRDGDVGTVYAYAEASGDSGVPVLDSKPTTANEGDIIAVGGRKYKASVNTQQVPNFANIAKLGDDDTDWWPDSRIGSDGTRRNDRPGNLVTNGLSLVNGDVVRIQNLNISDSAIENKCGVYFGTAIQSGASLTNQTPYFKEISVGETSSQATASFTGASTMNVRFGGTPTGAISDVIITKNEEITYRTETTVTWTDIGAYIPPVEAGWSATAETYAVIDSLSAAADGGTSAVYSADGYLYGYVGGTGWMQLSRYIAPTLSVDGELDDASRNAIQNRAVAQRFAEVDANVQTNASGITAINERLAEMTSGSGSVSVPSFWQNAVDACIAKIKALQVGRRCVTFPFFSDNHTRSGNIQYCGILIAHVMEACGIPYSFFGGDAITSAVASMADSDAEFREQSRAFDVAMSYIPRAKDCRALGNHEGALKGNPDIEGSATVTYTRAQTYEIFQRNKGADQNKHFGGDGTYYYVDDIASKVRWIILNGNSITGVNFCVDSEQVAWLTGTALKFDGDDWGVVLISHCPINNAYHANFINATEVIAAVNGASVDVIGWFSGHIHRDRIYTTMRVNATDNDEGEAGDPLGFTQVTITSDHTAIAYEDATRHGIGFDDKSHAIDFVTINRDTRTVNITRLGIGEDRRYNY